MKRKILVPMFASVVALSMNSVANADEKANVEQKEDKQNTLKLDEFKDVSYKVATVKDGVAVKIRKQGEVKKVAYTGEEFKVLGIQGEWVKISDNGEEGWLPKRFVDIKEAHGYTTENKVNFRKEANTDSDIIDELDLGSSLKVLEDKGEWVKVKKGEDEGYVKASYISDQAPVIEEQVAQDNQNLNDAAVDTNVSNNDTDNNDVNNNTNNSSSTSMNINSNSNKNNSLNTNKNTNSNSSTDSELNTIKKPSSNVNNVQADKITQDKNDSYNPPASNTSAAQAVVNLAYAKLGSPYVWGAEGPNSFDCSGLTSYVYRNAAGISLPRSSSAQAGFGQTVSRSNLKPGDLVFFSTNGTGNVSHVGIYVGGGTMIHSPKPGKSVETANINSSYYSSTFVTAKRVL